MTVELEPAAERPFRTERTEELARSGRLALRRDLLVWPDGMSQEYTVVEGPQAAVIVPVWEDGRTVLVRQWRHPWDASSWEVPSGTLGRDEDPLHAARRELVEEAGLEADTWITLGTGRPSASANFRFHFFLAQELRRVARAPEDYEQDMIVSEVPFESALEAAFSGLIVHVGSIAALVRAGRQLSVL